MKTIRSFIALELSDKIKNQISIITKQLKSKNLAVRWIPINNVHLTIKFLGDFPISSLENLKQTLENNIIIINKFDLQFNNIWTFPNINNPRIIWVGVQKNNSLEKLFNVIESIMPEFAIKPENRKFSPHLTIGRVKNSFSKLDSHQIKKIISAIPEINFGHQTVEEVILFKSTLTPQGAKYDRISNFRLKS